MVELYVITEFYLPKVAALLSIIGSSIIMGEVIRDMKSIRGASAVSLVLLSMSIGDILFSFGFFLGTWVSPPRDDGYFGGTAYGTHTSCAFQGFIIQFGATASLFFNASLGIVYLLMIQQNWREARIRKMITPMAISLWVVCLGVSLVPLFLDMYHSVGPCCWIGAGPYNCTVPSDEEPMLFDETEPFLMEDHATTVECQNESDTTFVIFFLQLLPVWSCIASDLVIMCMIYRMARNVEETMEEHRSSLTETRSFRDDDIDTGRRPRLESSLNGDEDVTESSAIRSAVSGQTNVSSNKKASRSVARQGLWYIGGFLLTYGFNTIAVIIFLATGSWVPALDRISYFFVALQGLWNFLIFSRARREMKTMVGRTLKSWIWENRGCCFRCQSRTCCRSQPKPIEAEPEQAKHGKKSGANQTKGRKQEVKKRSITLPPIEEEADDMESDSKGAPRTGILVGWKNSQRGGQWVSELGASGVSSHDHDESDNVELEGKCGPRTGIWVGWKNSQKGGQWVSELGASGVSGNQDESIGVVCEGKRGPRTGIWVGWKKSWNSKRGSQWVSDLGASGVSGGGEDEPIDMPVECEGKRGPWTGIWVAWKNWNSRRGGSHWVSDLEESGASSSEEESEYSKASKNFCEPNDSPPSKPFRVASETESPPVKPERLHSFQLQERTEPEKPPARPERLVSEKSDIETSLFSQNNHGPYVMYFTSSDEGTNASTTQSSQLQNSTSTTTSRGPPTKPMRLVSEASEMDSEVESVTVSSYQRKRRDSERPPSRPERFVSETSDIESSALTQSDHDAHIMLPFTSSRDISPKQASQLQTSTSMSSRMPPTKPVRLVDEASELDNKAENITLHSIQGLKKDSERPPARCEKVITNEESDTDLAALNQSGGTYLMLSFTSGDEGSSISPMQSSQLHGSTPKPSQALPTKPLRFVSEASELDNEEESIILCSLQGQRRDSERPPPSEASGIDSTVFIQGGSGHSARAVLPFAATSRTGPTNPKSFVSKNIEADRDLESFAPVKTPLTKSERPPARPERFLSEASDSESTTCVPSQSGHGTPPTNLMGFASRASELASEDETIAPSRTPPTKPMRFVSEASEDESVAPVVGKKDVVTSRHRVTPLMKSARQLSNAIMVPLAKALQPGSLQAQNGSKKPVRQTSNVPAVRSQGPEVVEP